MVAVNGVKGTGFSMLATIGPFVWEVQKETLSRSQFFSVVNRALETNTIYEFTDV